MPEWISIEDAEKPKYQQIVWVAYRSDGEIRTTLARYRGHGKWLTMWDRVLWEDVIAWMPLAEPKPPKGEGERE